MIPSSEHGLASSWLHSQDQFAMRLSRMLSNLYDSEGRFYGQQVQHPHAPAQQMDVYGFSMVTLRGLTVLKKLVDQAKDMDGEAADAISGIVPTRQTIYEALKAKSMDVNIVKRLCSLYASDS